VELYLSCLIRHLLYTASRKESRVQYSRYLARAIEDKICVNN
jgi:hypothetical protein